MDDRPTAGGNASVRRESADAVSPTTAFELLARRPRRQLLRCLQRSDDRTVAFDALVRRLADRDAGDAGDLRVALHHVHLPKLDAADVLDYDAEAGTVRYVGDPILDDLLDGAIRDGIVD